MPSGATYLVAMLKTLKSMSFFAVQHTLTLLVVLVQLKLGAVTKRSLILLLHCSHMVNFYSYNYSNFICYPSRAWLR